MAGGTSASFTYDAIGNRLTEVAGGTTNYTYPSTNSKLSSVGANSYTYDAMGNVTGDGARTYVWSAAGLLKEAKIGGTTVGAYTYSANNQRTKKVAGGTMTHYVYGLGGKLYGEYDNAGVLIREYVWLNGEPLAQVTKSGGTETVTYLHTDHLATPRYGTNAAGSTVWTWDSGAFGKEVPTGTVTVNLRFPGQYFDSETTLFYNWNRYYNPATGRYISSDPIGLTGGLNTFGYAGQSPVVFSDPEGLLRDTRTWPEPQTETETDLPSSIANAIPKVLRYCRLAGGVIVMVIIPVNETCATAPEKFPPGECGNRGCKSRQKRKIAEHNAYFWAGIDRNNSETRDITWKEAGDEGGAGTAWEKARQQTETGKSVGGHEKKKGSLAKVIHHPEGHSDWGKPGVPDWHRCPHYHAINEDGKEVIFTYYWGM